MDRHIFDITNPGVLTQCSLSVIGCTCMYVLARKARHSVLAALPLFVLIFCIQEPLIFVSYLICCMFSGVDLCRIVTLTVIAGLAVAWGYPFRLAIPRRILALTLPFARCRFHFRLTLQGPKVFWNHNCISLFPLQLLVQGPVRLSAAARKL